LEKRLPIALFLSFLVLFGWSLLFAPDPEEVQTTDPGQSRAAAQEPGGGEREAEGAAPAGEPSAAPGIAQREAKVEEVTDPIEIGAPGAPGHFLVRFSNRGAALHTLKLGGYFTRVGLDDAELADPANWLTLLESIETREGTTGSLTLRTDQSSARLAPRDLDRVLWDMELLREGDAVSGARFVYGPGTGVVFKKTIRFEPGTWRVDLELAIENRGLESIPRTAQFVLIPSACTPAELADGFYPEPRAIAVPVGGGDAEYEAAPGLDPGERDAIKVGGGIACAGVVNKYFAFLLRDAGANATIVGAKYAALTPASLEEERRFVVAELPVQLALPPVGESRSWSWIAYAGPKSPGEFVEDFEPHDRVLDSDLGGGFCGLNFTTIGHGLLWVLRWIHVVVGNWGSAIILLTFVVRLVLFPLNRRSQTAMARYQKKMKRVQPRLDEIKKKHENDPQKLREAQARIMQEEGAFPPLGGCLPMFLQMPIFFGLFSMLRTSFDLRQQPFAWWIDDLSRPDRLLQIDLALPLLGDVPYLNLLPILMVVMWVLQQKGMPQPADEQAARMQKMMLFMPVVFGFLLYNYAAGLSLYMLTTSTLGIFEQKVIKKVWPIDDTEIVKKKRSGCGPFAGFMEQLAEKQKAQMKRVEAMQAEKRRQGARRKKRR